jgi:hypothetical protein
MADRVNLFVRLLRGALRLRPSSLGAMIHPGIPIRRQLSSALADSAIMSAATLTVSRDWSQAMDFAADPIYNAIHNGIKDDIAFNFENKRFRAAVILIYTGMDAMAYLDMPDRQDDVTRSDFIRWVDRYIRFDSSEPVTGEDLYGARCAMLHSYGVVSKLSRDNKCRMVAYMDKAIPAVRFDESIDKGLLMLSIAALKDAFFSAIDRFLVAAFADKAKSAVVERRLPWLMTVVPFNRWPE